MPTAERLDAFIAFVEAREYITAIERFYHDDATMQENMGEERRGRNALIVHEMEVMNRYGNMPVRKVERYARNGDMVFINWVFEVPQRDGSVRYLDEIAMQEWDGDRIRRERFYYDPAQLK